MHLFSALIGLIYGLSTFLHTPKGEPMKKILAALAALAAFSGLART
jgi:hypothetical protein